ncbi:MAG: LCP family protein [Patescibacteria group bacterium]|nr:LCP family protein [Patescibacteria group bacterium]
MKQKKLHKNKVNFLFLIFLTILIVFSGFFFFGLNYLGWNTKTRFTVVFTSRPVLVVSFNPFDNSLTGLSIPSDTYVQTTHGYGSYRLGKVFDVGNLDKRGGEVLKSTVRELLGVPVDGYIDLQGRGFVGNERLTKDEFLLNRSKILGWQNFFRIIAKEEKTDINIINLEKFYSRTANTNAGKITFVNLLNSGVLADKTLPDQSQIKTVDNLRLDGLTADLFREDAIIVENLKLAVLNSTAVSGLGEKAARIISNMGVMVISVGNYDRTLNNCRIYTDKKNAGSLTVLKLQKIFGCGVLYPNLPGDRADAALVIGENYARELSVK